jgi:DNA-directed RNA polymerase specialized sigma24 family protein
MAERFFFQDCEPLIKEAVRNTWQEHSQKIDRLLKAYPPETRDIQVRDRKLRRQGEMAAALPALERSERQNQEPEFAALLRPHLHSLRDHAHRELVLCQLEGTLTAGVLTLEDVVNEVLVLAWERFHEGPPGLPLESWIVALVHEVLDRRAAEPPADFIEQELPRDDPRYQAEVGWVTDNDLFWQDLEPLTAAEVLPGLEAPDPWQQLVAEEERQRILELLRKVPRSRRRAFTLHVLEGWELEEVAIIQERCVAEVKADVDAIREALRQRVSEGEP